MSEQDWELIQQRQLAQQQLAEIAGQVRRLILRISAHEQAYLQQVYYVQSLIAGTTTGADQAIARYLVDAAHAVQQAAQSLSAAEAQCRSASLA